MNNLHPLAWLAICLSAALCVFNTENQLVSALCLVLLGILALLRGGSRQAAFGLAIRIGLLLFVIRFIVGLAIGPVSIHGKVLFSLPEIRIDQYTAILGPFTPEKLSSISAAGLTIMVLAAVFGLLWQSCPAGQWRQSLATIFGRGGQLFSPLFNFGEAYCQVSRNRRSGKPHGAVDLINIVEASRELAISHRRYTPAPQPNALKAGISTALLAILAICLIFIATFGGVLFHVAGKEITISASDFAMLLLLVWVLIRLSLGAGKIRPQLKATDLFAIFLALIVIALVYGAAFTGDDSYFHTPSDQWPQPPRVLSIGIIVAFACWGYLIRRLKQVKP